MKKFQRLIGLFAIISLLLGGYALRAHVLADDMSMGDGQMVEAMTPASFTPNAVLLNPKGWTATASDQQSGYPATNAIDGTTATIWHSQYSPLKNLPHSLTIDMKAATSIGGLVYTPRQDKSSNGNVGEFTITTSLDGLSWGMPVTSGTWADSKDAKTAVFPAITARFVRLTALTEAGNRGGWTSAAEVGITAQAQTATPLSRIGWTATASDQQSIDPASGVLDGNAGTIWHSQFSPLKNLPHSMTIDMKVAQPVNGIGYLPRQDASSNGNIGKYQVALSTNGTSWSTINSGQWADNKVQKDGLFPLQTARYVRLTALTEAGNRGGWTSAAELYVYGPNKQTGTAGSWSAPFQFPVTPAAAAVLPNNKVLLFAGYNGSTFNQTTPITAVAILNTLTGVVSQSSLINTNHQMFCSGLSMLADGRVLINGGGSDASSTIYNPYKNTWTAVAKMNIPRAYESTTLLSNGQALTLGGSWDTVSKTGPKNGEVYSPTATGPGKWTLLPNVTAANILTNDKADQVSGKIYRSDNHAWLFAGSNGTVFQAGPSKQMNWISTAGSGAMVSAGLRADSNHAMNGNAVMYAPGKILTLGGAPDYQAVGPSLGEQATNRAYTIDISAGYGKPVVAKRTGDMKYERSFANSVVLPDGTVIVFGGQQSPVPFTDTAPSSTPELWNPATGTFTTLNTDLDVARPYHSVALLLPDGRIFSGGGGLCGVGCTKNHPDGRIFTPPYLLNADGSLRVRPTITSAPTNVKHGTTIAVKTDGAVHSFALVRTSATTHTVNTDQRRIPLDFTGSGTSYTLTIPSDTGTVVPGSYMLFALNSAGTPSVAATMLLN